MNNLLEVNGIHTYIGQFHILEGVTLSVPQGEHCGATRPKWSRQDDDPQVNSGLDAAERRDHRFDGEEIQGGAVSTLRVWALALCRNTAPSSAT